MPAVAAKPKKVGSPLTTDELIVLCAFAAMSIYQNTITGPVISLGPAMTVLRGCAGRISGLCQNSPRISQIRTGLTLTALTADTAKKRAAACQYALDYIFQKRPEIVTAFTGQLIGFQSYASAYRRGTGTFDAPLRQMLGQAGVGARYAITAALR